MVFPLRMSEDARSLYSFKKNGQGAGPGSPGGQSTALLPFVRLGVRN